ncbi:MAG: DUF2249 domain-containing protein [Proteobacteria bacterium]|nr:DUF2249 domain-containing protein [Pseudomonadota bacterium]
MSNPETFKTTVDVRETPPRERHPLIFGSFDQLSPGEALTLINDHDPKPLFYQFQAESGGQFTWDYVETGPETWRVRIGKVHQVAASTL